MSLLDTELLTSTHAAVPYVPALGDVYPSAFNKSVEGVISVAGTTDFLPYDKDQRWYQTKQETVLKEFLYQDNFKTIIPTISLINKPLIKLHYYSKETGINLPDLEKLKQKFPNTPIQLITFQKELNPEYSSAVFIAELNDIEIKTYPTIVPIETLSPTIAATLPDLANNAPDNGGFIFLWERYSQNFKDGEILVYTEDDRIKGAIGPLKIGEDAIGQKNLMPPYFGVATDCRRNGIGKALWQAAISWAKNNKAEYLVFSAESSSPAHNFYNALGVKCLGGITRKIIG